MWLALAAAAVILGTIVVLCLRLMLRVGRMD